MANTLFKSLIILVFLTISAPSAVTTIVPSKGGLIVAQAWARASIGATKSGVVYLGIANMGEQADRLVAAETPVAAKAMLHSHTEVDGVMKMRPVDGVEVPAGNGGVKGVVFEPGGRHIMLMGLKAPLEEGESFRLTLIFERIGRFEVQVWIESATAMKSSRPLGPVAPTPE